MKAPAEGVEKADKVAAGHWKVPECWTWQPLGSLVSYVTSGSRDWSKYYSDSGALFIRTQDIRTNRLDLGTAAHVALPDRVEGKRTLLRPDDILITITGANVGRCALVPRLVPEAYVSQSVALVRLTVPDLASYLHHFTQCPMPNGRTQLENMAYGIGRPVLNLTNIRELLVPIAPLPEQQRIVEAIETHFTRLDAAVETLKRVQANLNRYRASVLKAAVEGRLVPTEAELARQEGCDYEPASVLLERILEERRRRWEEAELAKLKAKGKEPKNDKWTAKYKEPVGPDTSGLPELPEGWCWATADQLGLVSGGLTKNSARASYPVQLPYLRVANVYADRLKLDEILAIGIKETEIKRVLLRRDDLLIVEGNGSLDQIGRVATWDGSIDPCVHQNHLIKVRFLQPAMARWALTWLLSVRGRQEVVKVASSTSGLYNLSLSKVRNLPLPLAPTGEQARILLEVDRLLSVVDEVASEEGKTLQRCHRLRQSILKWAFEGWLVDQDPNDEPASELLERIKATETIKTPAGPIQAELLFEEGGRKQYRVVTLVDREKLGAERFDLLPDGEVIRER